jgi:hypothetical protein
VKVYFGRLCAFGELVSCDGMGWHGIKMRTVVISITIVLRFKLDSLVEVNGKK